ncbi:E3 ubiquitin-protein ligase APD2-like isoform X2 [Mangifera indica]|uniref:E3 ubiquitin-protein ligase APD2-like isoform X2 n=1 Tax=Mangifera indica TaxID=29780 RepID=UPI001CFB8EB9|nr:E3 ubiquitin-protein ligase APD2-like isoform X2 [Mangifera indica]
MFRAVLAPPMRHRQRWQESWARLIPPLTLWICVTVSLRYGYYGDCRMVLGPSASRLMKASSVFVKQVEVRDDDKKGVLLYGFCEKPELSFETNWSVSKVLIVGSYRRKGFSLWLNEGSRIRMRFETQSRSLNQLQLVMIKGERKFQTLLPKLTSSSESLALTDIVAVHVAEYTIEEDDRYYIGVINVNPKSVIMTMTVNVTSKMYDLTKAKNVCSTLKGLCRLQLLFPNTHYVILTTPNNFVQACDGENDLVATREISGTDPIIPVKPVQYTYGTNQEDDDSGSSTSSSEDLYDAKLCVICYDDQRNCFFVPCGHCATCYDCAQRIVEEDSKMCPICRRLIHKVRRLFNP